MTAAEEGSDSMEHPDALRLYCLWHVDGWMDSVLAIVERSVAVVVQR